MSDELNNQAPVSIAPDIDWFETCLNVVHEHKKAYVVTRDDLKQRGKANAALYANFVEVCDSISQAIHDLKAMPYPTPSPQSRLVGHLSVACSQEEAIRFLEMACRNWSHVPRLSPDDLGDVATALVHFVARKSAVAASEGSTYA